jgi:hypothetical protein
MVGVEGVFFGMGEDDSRRKLTDGRIEVGRVARPGGGRHGWPESRLLGPHRNVNGRPPSQNFGVALDFRQNPILGKRGAVDIIIMGLSNTPRGFLHIPAKRSNPGFSVDS